MAHPLLSTRWRSRILVALISVSEISPYAFRGDGANLFEPQVAASVLANAVNEYERHGTEAFFSNITINHNDVYLLDQHSRVLAKSGSPPPFYLPMARGVLQSGHSQILRLPTRLVFPESGVKIAISALDRPQSVSFAQDAVGQIL